MGEKTGHYETKGDVEEWVWDDDGPGVPKLTGGWVVPEGEFDPTSAPSDVTSASEKAASSSAGLQVAIEAKVEEEVEEEVDLETLTKAELQQMALDAGMDSSGSKAELIERLAD